ncbi:MAG: TlpA family protein disulfide reductase [Oscillospiraceae bacterium]|nr:TlpA family protein disulfide reductase [Oscillospiraceae bacterium]
MKLRDFLPFLAALLLLAALASGCEHTAQESPDGRGEGMADDGSSQKKPEPKIEAGSEVPDFEVELCGGGTIKLSDCRGKAVLVTFWATWCEPCAGELSNLQRLFDTYAEKLVVLAVNCGEDKETVESFVRENGYTFYVGLDPDGALQANYPTNALPYTIVVGPEGNVASVHLGTGSDMLSVYEKELEAALGKTGKGG